MLGSRGNSAGSIFTTGPIITKDQSGRAAASAPTSSSVHPLIHHAEEADAGVRDGGLVGGVRLPAPGGGEMRRVDRGGEAGDARVPAALGLVQAAATGEDQVGARQQVALQLDQPRRGAAEGGELIHAVIDGQVGMQMAGEFQRHRRVEPGNHRPPGLAGQQAIEQFPLGGDNGIRRQALRQQRHGDGNALGCLMGVQPGGDAGAEQRFLQEDHRMRPGGPRQQVLRPLEHEIPAQMGQAQQQRR